MNLIINESDLVYLRQGGQMPEIVTTIHQLGIFEAFFFSFLVYIVAVVCHELGHWFIMLRYNPNAKIYIKRKGIGLQLQTGTEQDYVILEKQEKLALYTFGIIGGLFPIILAGFVHDLYLLVLPAYFVGTYRDFQLIYYLLKNKTE